jgi:hypothetical protein
VRSAVCLCCARCLVGISFEKRTHLLSIEGRGCSEVNGLLDQLEDVPSPISLRRELSHRALALATSEKLLHEVTDGEIPSIIFGRDEAGCHGNFYTASYKRICSEPRWARRLGKVHTASKKSKCRANWRWMELDCANSSDALLMNIFCYPETLLDGRVARLLGVEIDALPEFGFKPRTPLHAGRRDTTEIDMKIGNLLLEAKLTENDFQWAKSRMIDRYRDLEEIFHRDELPVSEDRYGGYQLIRGTLAAYATNSSFCVLCDARRPDLIEKWYAVMRAVRCADLRCRLKILTWQELASVLPTGLQTFLEVKYGITQ